MTIDPRSVREELSAFASPERAAKEKQYLKSELEFLGVSVPVIRRVTRRLATSLPTDDPEALLTAVGSLWSQPVHELRSVAAMLLEARADLLRSTDLPVLETMLREARTWAHVDLLAVHVVGRLAARFADVGDTLDRWSTDDDFWIRRSALLALLVPLREGGGDWDRFAGYAERMWAEREFFIRKAIGWVLRDAAKKSPERVVRFLRPRAHTGSGVTMREAVKYLPAPDRDALLTAYRDRIPLD